MLSDILNRQICRQHFITRRRRIMSKKGENIYKRKDGRWEGRYIKGRHPDGKPVYGYIYGYKYKEVRDRILPMKSYYLSQNTIHIKFWGTLRDWTLCWMQQTVQTKIKPSTYANYYGMLENHILPALGGRKLASITQAEVQHFIALLEQKRLGVNAIRNICGMLNRVMKAAFKQGAILANPCQNIELPSKEKASVRALSLSEQHKLEIAAAKDENGIAVFMALYTGMRIGEISALRWDDVDLDSGKLYVSRTAQRISRQDISGTSSAKTRLYFGKPKSASGKRIIPLTPKLSNLLREEREFSKSPYVVSCCGNFTEPRTIRYRYEKILKAAGIERLHFHGLRHTFSTRCIEQNMDVAALSRILGHSSIKMTLDTYVDSMYEQQASSIHKLDRLFAHA